MPIKTIVFMPLSFKVVSYSFCWIVVHKVDKLDYLYNATTQNFLQKSALKSGQTVLDIGCGSGIMTCWIAEQIGPEGIVIDIENNVNQLNAAKSRASKLRIKNAKFELYSAYDLAQLKFSKPKR